MDAPESVQTSRAGPKSAKVRNMNTFVVPDDNIGDVTTAGYDQAYLFIELPGNGCCFPYYLSGDNFLT